MHKTRLQISSEGTGRVYGRSLTLASMCFLFYLFTNLFFFCVLGTLLFAVVFYMASGVAAFMLFWNYTIWEGCLHNKIFIGINTLLCIILSAVTIIPAVTRCKSTGLLGLQCQRVWVRREGVGAICYKCKLHVLLLGREIYFKWGIFYLYFHECKSLL